MIGQGAIQAPSELRPVTSTMEQKSLAADQEKRVIKAMVRAPLLLDCAFSIRSPITGK